jgi:glycosyl hydrolase family 2
MDNGRVLVGADVETMLQITGIRRERVVDSGVELIRRRDDMGYLYFLTNLGHQRVDQWTSLSIQAASIAIFDPVSTCHGMARMGLSNQHDTQIYLQLEPGESILLRTYSRPIDGPQWQYLTPAGEPFPLQGPWRVEFIAGGPTLPMPTVVEQLISWTDWPDESGALRMFSGTARYTLTFDRPSSSAERWALDLGGVYHSARVKLNGQRVGTYYARPFRLVLPPVLREGSNQLEIEVTNLMANRLAELDRQGRQWQKFFFINSTYQPFDASDWTPLPSGLLGPVRLVPLRQEFLNQDQ